MVRNHRFSYFFVKKQEIMETKKHENPVKQMLTTFSKKHI